MLIYIIFLKKSHTLNIPFQKCMKMQPLEPWINIKSTTMTHLRTIPTKIH